MAKQTLTAAALRIKFQDCRAVLDACIANNGCTVTLPTAGKATNFRQRCYSFRKAMNELDTNLEYATIKITTDPKLLRRLIFEFHSVDFVIKTLDGDVIKPEDRVPPVATETLTVEEADLLAGLNLETED